jgi:hypothetical protein
MDVPIRTRETAAKTEAVVSRNDRRAMTSVLLKAVECPMTIVNPFDLRTVLLAKHAQHVVLVHFPIALFITGVGLDLLSRGQTRLPTC